MIRINLLQVKRAPKVAPVANEAAVQVGIGVAIVVVFLGACGYRWLMLSDEIAQQTQVQENKKEELDDLKKKVVEVESLEKNLKLLEDKNRIIEQLKKNQGTPVRLLDLLSQCLDPLKVWLTGIEEASPQITVDGKALSNDDIVAFIKNLQQVNFFSNVFLEESRQAILEGVVIYQFKLKMTIKA